MDEPSIDNNPSGSHLSELTEEIALARQGRALKGLLIVIAIIIFGGIGIAVLELTKVMVRPLPNQPVSLAPTDQTDLPSSPSSTTPKAPVKTAPSLTNLRLTSYGTTYSLLWLPDRRPIQYCIEHEGDPCGDSVASIDNKPVVKIAIYDSAKVRLDDYAKKDCKVAFTSENSGKQVGVCASDTLAGSILYYTFRLTLGGREHLGLLSGGVDKGVAFTDVGLYQTELTQIIPSIQLVN